MLVSGDSDFEPLVKYLRDIQKKVIVVSSRGHISRELIKCANEYLPLERIRDEVKKTVYKKSPPIARGEVH